MANLLIDRVNSNVTFCGGQLDVNEVEFEILWTLVNKPGRSYSAEDLVISIPSFEPTEKAAIRIAMESLADKLSPWINFDQHLGFNYRRA